MVKRTIAALVSLAFTAAFASPAHAAGAVIEIPTILPLTGPAAFLGKEFSDTLKLVEEQTNKAGGIAGRPLHFVIEDDQSNPQVAVQLGTAALSKNPALLINGGPLALCAAVAPLVKSGPVMYCLSPSMHAEAGSYSYAIMSSSRDVLLAALDYYKGRGFKKIGVLNGTDATGIDADAILAEIIKLPQYAGMSYVAYEHFNLADLSVAAQVARVKASGAEALIAYTTGAPIATVLRGIADGNLTIPVFTSNGNMSVAQLDSYKSFVPKELLFAAYPALTADPVSDRAVAARIEDFRTQMKAAGASADLLHAIPWDPAYLIVDAFRRAGPDASPLKLRDALNGVDGWPGLLGRYSFKAIPNRGLGLKALIVARWDPARSTWITVKS